MSTNASPRESEEFLYEPEVMSTSIQVLGCFGGVPGAQQAFSDTKSSLNLLGHALCFAKIMYRDNKDFSEHIAKMFCIWMTDSCLSITSVSCVLVLSQQG